MPESFAILAVDGNLLSQNASFAIGGLVRALSRLTTFMEVSVEGEVPVPKGGVEEVTEGDGYWNGETVSQDEEATPSLAILTRPYSRQMKVTAT